MSFSSKWSISTLRKNISNTRNKTTDDFIISHFRNTQHPQHETASMITDIRRIVFVSVVGLFNTWNRCPSYLLFTAIFIMPLKSKWVYHPSKYIAEIEAQAISQDMFKTKRFIDLLKWKDSQSLVFWMLDDYEAPSQQTLVSPFWFFLSETLTNLYDPVTRNYYKPLKLDTKRWEQQTRHNLKYCEDSQSIVYELYFITKKFNCIQEIIYQSNPGSFLPLLLYNNDKAVIKYKNSTDLHLNMDANWWIAEDYDPFDV